MPKREKQNETADKEESALTTEEIEAQGVTGLRRRVEASLSALRPQLFSDNGTGGKMIEPTLETIHLQEELLRALALCDAYDAAETMEEMITLAHQLNALDHSIAQLWNARTKELEEQQARIMRGEKVRTDGNLVIPPNWDQLPKHLRH